MTNRTYITAGVKNETNRRKSTNYLMVSAAAEKLGEQACTLGIKHIKNGILRLQFNREVAYYAKSIVNDVSEGKKSPEQGLKN